MMCVWKDHAFALMDDYFCPHCRYLNAIQTMCPHILRYLTTAVITNKDVRKRRQVLKDLVKVIQQVMKNLGPGLYSLEFLNLLLLTKCFIVNY